MGIFLLTIKILPGMKLKYYISYWFNKLKLQIFRN